jgi:hypothetical protein
MNFEMVKNREKLSNIGKKNRTEPLRQGPVLAGRGRQLLLLSKRLDAT